MIKKNKGVKHIEIQMLTFLLLSILLFLPILQVYGGESSQPKLIKVKIAYVPYIASAPLFIAEDEGFFTEQGLQVEFVKTTEAVDALPALIKGEIDVITDILFPSYFNAITRGGKIKMVADRGHLSPTGCTYTAIMARKSLVEDGKLNHLSQLKGRRIGITQTTAVSGYFLDKALDQAGLTLPDVETAFLQMPARVEAFKKGAIDISLATEPWITKILETGHAVVWMPIQKIVPNLQFAFLMYGSTFLEMSPDAGKNFMVAYLRGVRQYNQGKTERNLEIIAKHTGLDQGFLKRCCWQSIQKDGQININSILDFQAWALKKGFLDKVVPPNQFWDPKFIEYANKVLSEPKK